MEEDGVRVSGSREGCGCWRGEERSGWKHIWVLIDVLCRGFGGGEGGGGKMEWVKIFFGYLLIDALCRGVDWCRFEGGFRRILMVDGD